MGRISYNQALADGNPSREGQWPPLTGLRDRKLTHSQRFRAGLISFALRAGRRPLLTQSFTFLNSTCQPALEECASYFAAAALSACNCCSAYTFASPRCSAAMPSQAARAAESVVMVGMWAMTAARRMAFSSNQGSTPWGVLMIN